MNAATELEDRIRRGLHAAAEALPPPPQARPSATPQNGAHTRMRWITATVAGAAAVAAVVAAVVVAGRDGERGSDVELESPSSPRTPDEPDEPDEPDAPEVPEIQSAANGMVPGQAVIVGNMLNTYDPAGALVRTVPLAPLENVQSASSDLTGGWVACGMVSAASTESRPPGESPTSTGAADDTVPGGFSDPLIWFPQGREPVELGSGAMCMADSVRVVDSPEGPTAFYLAWGSDGSIGNNWRAVVLATGQDRELDLPVDPEGFYRWSTSPGRIIVHSDESGFQLFDISTGESLPVAPIELSGPSDVALAPDATSVAVIVGEVDGASDLVVYDLATGAERYRETFPDLATEGAQLSYDGTTVAVGNYYEGYDDVVYPPVTIINLATGARHTVDAHGLVL